ncbi:MAG: hypothetical protein IT484_00925 [Gammaproteobacteria bacterium]|nr:hypothetical protein [Gammaproteobacteria bacterium]
MATPEIVQVIQLLRESAADGRARMFGYAGHLSLAAGALEALARDVDMLVARLDRLERTEVNEIPPMPGAWPA